MARLTIELVENQYALYDVIARLNDKRIFEGENYTSEEGALTDAYDMVKIAWWHDANSD